MNTSPYISVVVPCLNRAHFLIPTIESILQQDYPHIECIVIDGGSTDGTLDILKSYGDRIRWVSEPDHGHADAINKGWKMSKGDILAWLNADDVWEVPNAASQAVAYLQNHPDVDVVYGDCGSIDRDGNVIGMSYLHEWDLEYAVEFCDHCIPQPAAFIRRTILEKAGWLDETFISKKDHELWPRIGLIGTIKHLPILLAHARNCQGYMAKRGDITAAACVALTKKFFTLPHIPAALLKKKRRSISNAYLKGIDYAWHDGHHWGVMIQYAGRAILTDVSNTFSTLKQLKHYIEIDAPEHFSGRLCLAVFILLMTPVRLWRQIKAIFALKPARGKNLAGDRDIEWSWIASQMPTSSGEALDFGNGGSFLGLIAAQRGFHVTAIDLASIEWDYLHPNLRFLQGDLLELPLSESSFDLIINCSTVEHVGLTGRYGVMTERADGDLEAMARLRTLLKPEGIMLLTIPVGRDVVFAPLCRVYGSQRLPRLLAGYEIVKEVFWTKNNQNRWQITAKSEALDFEAFAGSWDARQNITALGCFTLKKSSEG